MFQSDTITFLTQTEVNTNGSIKLTFVDGDSITVDAQYISKEKVSKDYGLTDANEWLQIFDLSLSVKWSEGEYIKYNGIKYKVRKVIPNQAKIGASNHVFVVASMEVV